MKKKNADEKGVMHKSHTRRTWIKEGKNRKADKIRDEKGQTLSAKAQVTLSPEVRVLGKKRKTPPSDSLLST